MSRRPALLAVVLAAAAGALAQAPKYPKSELVATQEGELPVIITAPHGGAAKIPDVPARTGDALKDLPKGRGFVAGADTNTEPLAYATAAAVKEKTGKAPYYVVAKFARRYIDANRPPEHAYEDPKAKPTYDAYHATIAAYCREVKAKYGRGLLIDIHGQGQGKDTVYRGTADGKTVALLRQRFGEKAHTGPKSFFGLMAANGFKVFPADLTGKEQAGLSGGHTVRKYGEGDFGIDAIQLEFGAEHRAKDAQKDTAAKVAAVVAEYAKLYLTDEKKP